MPREGYRRDRDPYTSDRERERRRRERRAKHESNDSTSELLVETRRRSGYYRESPGNSPVKTRTHHDDTDDSDRERRRRERRAERRRERDREELRERDREERRERDRGARRDTSEVDRYADRERLREERRRREREADLVSREEIEVKRYRRRDESRRRLVDDSETSHPSTDRSNGLSMEGLAALNAINEKLGVNRGHNRVREEVDNEELLRREERRRRKEEKRRRRIEEEAYERGPDVYDEYLSKERREEIDYRSTREKKGRVVSGQKLERGRDSVYDEKSQATSKWWQLKMRGGGTSSDGSYINSEELAQRKKKRRRNILILLGLIVLILVIAIPVGIAVSKNSGKSSSNSGATDSNGKPSNSNLDGIDQSSIPASAKGTWLDPFSWYDTNDFNVTFTDVMVGGLPIMGLNSTWDDSTRANSNVPPLNEAWKYGTMPVRGINVGGWLVLEPVITPSFFNSFKSSQGVIDEYTLTSTLGTGSAKSTIEQHYSSFLTEQDFVNIQAAGFDHVRIPFGYWTIVTYQGDPYVSQVAWRYLLRAIEWARKYGIRVNLDLHGAPGSQNGWNHSGRQGDIGWLNGTDGALNANRTLQIHDQLSKFFAQDRYKNIIAFYGLLNEPRMTSLDTTSVLQWTTEAATLVQKNGINCTIVFGDGFMGLDNWQGKLQSVPNMLLDVHQYVIFNTQQLTLNHQAKTTFACGGWTAQAKRSMDTTTGFGPTIFAEWSQADTDCAPYLNNVGVGSRWQGTLNMVDTPGGGQNGSVLTPTCPTANNPRCMCDGANASPSAYSAAYKQWLLQFAVAQMESFEYGWGWFYWTWKTESAAQWSYKDGLAAGILPGKVWERDFKCASGAPDYASLGLPEYY